MNFLKVILIASFVFVLVGCKPVKADTNLYERATGIFIGEGADTQEDFYWLACTVKNRLARGWSESNVMSAYYAKYHKPNAEDVAYVKDVILNQKCPAAYFAFSNADIRWANKVAPLLSLNGVNYYAYEDYARLFN